MSVPEASAETPDLANLIPVLRRLGLISADATPAFSALTGGVASDIWKVNAEGHTFVVKRALAKLRVKADWRAPISRNAAEVEWLRTALRVVPHSAPEIFGHDSELGLFAMTYLEASDHPLWKSQLAAGLADPSFAAAVGRSIVRIHAATAGDRDIAAQFANDGTFHAIRLEPYLENTALRHPDLHDRLHALSHQTLYTKRALVHGDLSPKNILNGPHGPVFLDAECAWYGDPAFDLAFCLNHMLLKSVWVPRVTEGFLACFDALAASYLSGTSWEASDELEQRASALLPALLLARIDGKSPVEYITDDALRRHVRAFARPLVSAPPSHLAAIRQAWREHNRSLN